MALGRVTGGPGDGEDIVVDRRIVEQRIRLRLRVGDQLGDIERARLSQLWPQPRQRSSA